MREIDNDYNTLEIGDIAERPQADKERHFNQGLQTTWRRSQRISALLIRHQA
jgi:hypothetical protein